MNNYWKKLGSGILALLMVVQMGVVPVSVAEENNQPDVQGASVTSEVLYQETTPIETKTLSTSQEYIDEVVRLVNIERAKENLNPLSTQENLSTAAGIRAVELDSYYSHFRPDYSEFSTVLDECNVERKSGGENIAQGQRTPAAVVEAWMNSDGHRGSILNSNFDYIGVGYSSVRNSWVQLFISTTSYLATGPTLNRESATYDLSSENSYKILVINGAVTTLASVEINGVPAKTNEIFVCGIYYYVELYYDFLKTLGPGVHVIKLTYADGTVLYFTLTITGESPDVTEPPTGGDVLPSDSILALSPANGSTNIPYKTNERPTFSIEFDRAISTNSTSTTSSGYAELDFSKVPLKIHSASDDSVIMTVIRNEYVTEIETSTDVTIPLFESANTLILYGYGLSKLESSTSYYITLGEGFVVMADGSTSPEIKKGDWCFTTKNQNNDSFSEEIPFNAGFNEGFKGSTDQIFIKEEVTFDNKWFTETAYKNYNHDLAITSIALSGASYEETNLTNALGKLGFSDVTSKNYDIPRTQDNNDLVSYAYGTKTIYCDDGDYTLIGVVIKGTSADTEWYSNFNIGEVEKGSASFTYHYGLNVAMLNVLAELRAFCNVNNLDASNTKFYITGHSRGAGVANLLAAMFTDTFYAHKENVFAYTFASPLVSTNATQKGYENIINITNGEDFISRAPLASWGYKHYGIDLMLPNHSYYAGFLEDLGDDKFFLHNYSNLKTQMENLCFDLTGEYPVHFGGTTRVDSALNSMLSLAPTVEDYYNSYHLGGTTLISFFNPLQGGHGTPNQYFQIIAKVKSEGGWISETFGKVQVGAEYLGSYSNLSRFFVHYGNEIATSHSVASYYSWLKSASAEILFTGTDVSTAANYKTVTVACPVNLYVYDSSGDLVASVVDDQVVINTIAVTLVELYDEDGYLTGEIQKVVDLPSGQEYNIVIESTDVGTMEYYIEEKVATGVENIINRLVSFETIVLEETSEFTATINDTVATSVDNYALETNGETIEASSDVFFNESPFEITLDPNGGTCATTSLTTDSDSTLSTLPTPTRSGYTFNGWYTAESGGTKITTSYVFSTDTTIYAQWSETGTSGDDSQIGSTGGSSSGGTPSSSFTTPILNVSTGGSAAITPEQVENGKTVTITTTADAGYALSSITVIDADKVQVEVKENEDGTHKFTQPIPKVTIEVTFVPEPEKESINPENLFHDVNTSDWYYSSVKFVLEEGLMAGMGNSQFAPDDETQRAMILTMLYSLAEKPTPSISSGFADISTTSYYAKPVAWAEQQQIISSNESSFYYPESDIPREEICVVLFNYVKTQTDLDVSTKSDLPFHDKESISSSAKEAVLWCYENEVVSGRDGGVFDASVSATRAEIATMIRKFVMLLDN